MPFFKYKNWQCVAHPKPATVHVHVLCLMLWNTKELSTSQVLASLTTSSDAGGIADCNYDRLSFDAAIIHIFSWQQTRCYFENGHDVEQLLMKLNASFACRERWPVSWEISRFFFRPSLFALRNQPYWLCERRVKSKPKTGSIRKWRMHNRRNTTSCST